MGKITETPMVLPATTAPSFKKEVEEIPEEISAENGTEPDLLMENNTSTYDYTTEDTTQETTESDLMK